MTATQFHHLQSNLSEIYAALQTMPKGDDLPLYAISPSFYFFPLGLTGKIIVEGYKRLSRQQDEDLSTVAASASLYFQGCWSGQVMKTLDQTWRWIEPVYSSSQVKTIAKLVMTTVFDQAVHVAYQVRQCRIWNNMRQIDQIWGRRLRFRDFEEQRKRYEQFLAVELEGSVEVDNPVYLNHFDERGEKPLSVQEVKAQRHTIVNFHQATYFFWSLFIKDENDNALMREPLMHWLQPSSLLMDCSLFKALKKERHWVQMEGILDQSIPVALLAKLANPDSLTISEKNRLRLWIKALNRCQQDISVKHFSCILSEIMNVIHLQGSSHLTLADLLEWLDQQGCQLIYKEDPAHMNWRAQLAPGDTIECNGKKLILGQQLSPDKVINDTFKIFELEDYSNEVVKIAHNRFILLVESKKGQSEQEHWGIRWVATIDNLEEEDDKPSISGLDSQGRCVVMEKLSSPLDRHVWTSKAWELEDADEEIALVFANHIFCMAQWGATSQDLSLSHLMWDKEGILKSTRLLKKGTANYNDLEAYCESAAKHNPHVLSFLMHVSKLSEHPMALYYRKAVEFTLETGKTDLIGRPLPKGHQLDIYNQHISQLCEEALALRENCFKHLFAEEQKRDRYAYKQEGALRKNVADRLLQFYRVLPIPGRFPSHFERQVINSFTTRGLLLDPANAKDYYKEKYDLMMAYNQAVLNEIGS